mgnify:CR=1 FL=1
MDAFSNHSVSDLIQLRTSWRSCTGEAIPQGKRTQLEQFIKSKTEGVGGEPLRFELVAAREGDSTELRGLGTYGFIKGASGFIVGAIDKQITNLEDYGYLMEEIVLFATSLDLATCWLGGSFRQDNFSSRISIQPNEIVPAVVSVGLHTDTRNVVDRLIRRVAGSNHRLPWKDLFFESDFHTPLHREDAGNYAHVFDMVRISPSASNKQPWRYVRDADTVHLFLQRTPGYKKPNFFSDLQRIDMGISMCHFEMVCRELEIVGKWVKQNPPSTAPENWEYVISWEGGA